MSYKNVVIKAVNLAIQKNLSPVDAWERVVVEEFPGSKESQKKSCPKNTFLGLCEEGKINGIPSGTYTRSIKNKRYALNAIKILSTNSALTASELWKEVLKKETDKNKVPNSQMEVVLALWKIGLIRK